MNAPLGIIAGSKNLPIVIAREARSAGVSRIVAVAFENETNPDLALFVDEIVWLRVGQLSKMIGVFKDRGIKKCVMAGQIAPKNLFDLRPDLKAMMLLFRLKEKNAHTIFGAIGDELAKAGVSLVEATPWLRSVMPAAGFRLGNSPTKDQQEDIAFGYEMAKKVSALEIGQTVVVKDGTVLAVEGFEGTDACLVRGGQLAGPKGGAVAVKVARENHDMRFDIPCIGAQTIQSCLDARIAVLAIETGKTILLDREEIQSRLKTKKLALVTCPS
jgi:UDP-2,3-diacylglucosamine hydrolase